MVKTGKILAAGILTAAAMAAPAYGRTMPEAATFVPAEAYFMAAVKNVGEVIEQWKQTDLYAFYSDPAMAPLAEEARKAFEEARKDELTGAILGEDGIRTAGAAVFAVVPAKDEAGRDDIHILSAVQLGDELDKAREIISRLERRAIDDGGSLRSEEFRGLEIVTQYAPRCPDVEDASARAVMSYCFVGDILLAGDEEQVKFAAAHMKGAGGNTLSDDPEFRGVFGRVGEGDIKFYVNLRQMIRKAEIDTEDELLMRATGLDKLSAAATSVSIARESGVNFGIKTFFQVDGDKTGLLRIMDLRSVPPDVPAFVPAESYDFGIVNLDLNAAFDEIVRIVNSIEPMIAGMMMAPVVPASPEGPALELKRDIFAHLRPGVVFCQSVAGDSEAVEYYTLIGVATSDRETLERSLSRVYSMVTGDRMDERRDFLGHTIYGFPVEGTERGLAFGFTVTDTHVLGGEVAAVERALRVLGDRDRERLESKEWFRRARGRLPASAGYMGAIDYSRSFELLWNNLTKGEGLSQFFTVYGMGGRIDFNKMPDFEEVRKYFDAAVFYFESVDDGFLAEYKWLKAGR